MAKGRNKAKFNSNIDESIVDINEAIKCLSNEDEQTIKDITKYRAEITKLQKLVADLEGCVDSNEAKIKQLKESREEIKNCKIK